MQCACAILSLFRGLSGSTIFVHIISKKGTIFEKTVTDREMCVWIFSSTSVLNIRHVKKNRATYDNKCKVIMNNYQ